MTSLICPKAYTTPNWRWSTTNKVELAPITSSSKVEKTNPTKQKTPNNNILTTPSTPTKPSTIIIQIPLINHDFEVLYKPNVQLVDNSYIQYKGKYADLFNQYTKDNPERFNIVLEIRD